MYCNSKVIYIPCLAIDVLFFDELFLFPMYVYLSIKEHRQDIYFAYANTKIHIGSCENCVVAETQNRETLINYRKN